MSVALTVLMLLGALWCAVSLLVFAWVVVVVWRDRDLDREASE